MGTIKNFASSDINQKTLEECDNLCIPFFNTDIDTTPPTLKGSTTRQAGMRSSERLKSKPPAKPTTTGQATSSKRVLANTFAVPHEEDDSLPMSVGSKTITFFT